MMTLFALFILAGQAGALTPEQERIPREVDALVVSHRGHVYFTETGKQQVTLVDLQTKQKRAADTGITAPNGITLSPDQGTLAVSDYKGAHVWAFRVEADGSLAAKAPFMTMRLPIDPAGEFKLNKPPPYEKESGGDGMTSDTVGRYYVATTLGVQVFDPTGRECGLLPKPDPNKPLTSCALPGPDRGYLYITHGDKILRRKVQAVGNVFFQAPAGERAATLTKGSLECHFGTRKGVPLPGRGGISL
ncbi:MAG: SMP-30/gluconolactonase/LRE family protein [Verrucomicrobiota bacterium]|nr:SMP-30/gluconolactonase/LRE family protein [Verrucomicrobiota bacterium]